MRQKMDNKNTKLYKRLLTGIFFLGVTTRVLAETSANGSALEAGIYSQVGNITSGQKHEVLYASTYLPEIVVTPYQPQSIDSHVSTNIYSPLLTAEPEYINGSHETKRSNQMLKEMNSESFEINTSFSVSDSEVTHTQMLTSLATGQMKQDLENANVESHTHEAVRAHYDDQPYTTATILLEELMDYSLTSITSINTETDTQTNKIDNAEHLITPEQIEVDDVLITPVSSPKEYQTADLDTNQNQSSSATALSEEHMDYPLPLTETTSMVNETATQDAEQLITTVSSLEAHQTAELNTIDSQLSTSTMLSNYMVFPLPLTTHMAKGSGTQTNTVDGAEQLITTVSSPEAYQTADLYTTDNQSSIATALSEEHMDYPLPHTNTSSTGKETTNENAELVITTVSSKVHRTADLYTTKSQSSIITELSEEYRNYPPTNTLSMDNEITIQDAEQLLTTISSPESHKTNDQYATKNQSSILTILSEEHIDYPLPFTTTHMKKETGTQTNLADGADQLIATVSSHHTVDLHTTENQLSFVTTRTEEHMGNLLTNTSMGKETTTQDVQQLITTGLFPEAHQTADVYTTENQSSISTPPSEEYMDYPLPLTTYTRRETGTQTTLLDGVEQPITTASFPESHQTADLDTTQTQSSSATIRSEEYLDYSVLLTNTPSTSKETTTEDEQQFLTTASSPEAYQTAKLSTTENQSSNITALSKELTDYPLPLTTQKSKKSGTQTSLVDGSELVSTIPSPEVDQTDDLDTTWNQSSIATAISEEYIDYLHPLTTSVNKKTGKPASPVDGTEQLITTVSFPEVHQTVDLDTTEIQSSIATAVSEEYMDYPLPLTTYLSKETGTQTHLVDDTWTHLVDGTQPSLVDGAGQQITIFSPEAHQTTDLDITEKPSSTATILSEEYVDYSPSPTNIQSKETTTQDEKQLITTYPSPKVYQIANQYTTGNQSSIDTAVSEEYMDYPLSLTTSVNKEIGTQTSLIDGTEQLITTVAPEIHQTADMDTPENQSGISAVLLDDSTLHTSTMDMNKETNTQASWVYGVNHLNAAVVPDTHQRDNVDTTENGHIIFDQNLELMMNSTDSILIAHDFLDFAGILENNVTHDAGGNDSSHETTTHGLHTNTFIENGRGRNFIDGHYSSATTVDNEARNTNENITEYYVTPPVNNGNATQTLLTTTSIENWPSPEGNFNSTGEQKYAGRNTSKSISHSEAGSSSESDVHQLSTQRNFENLWGTEESTYESTVLNKLHCGDCDGEITELLDTLTKSTDLPLQYHTSEFISDETVTVVQDSIFSREVIPKDTDPENITTEIYTFPLHGGENLSSGHQKRSTSDRNETEHLSVDTDPDTEVISLVPSTSISEEVSATVDNREQTDTILTLQYTHHQNLTAYNWIVNSTQGTPITNASIFHINELNETSTGNHDMQHLSTDVQTSALVGSSTDMNSLSANVSVAGHNKISTVENLLDITTPQGEATSLFTSSNPDAFHSIFYHINKSESEHTDIYGTTETASETLAGNTNEIPTEQNSYSSEFHYESVIYTSDSEENNLTNSFVHRFSYELTSETPELMFSTKSTFDESVPLQTLTIETVDGSVSSQTSTTETDISIEISTQPPPGTLEVSPSLSQFSSMEPWTSITDSSEYLAEELEHSSPSHTEGVRDSRTISDFHSHKMDYDMRTLTSEQNLLEESFSREVTIQETEISHQLSTQSLPSDSEATASFDSNSMTISGTHSHKTSYDTRLLTSEQTSDENFSRKVKTEISTHSSLSSSSETIFASDYYRNSSELPTEGFSTVEYLTQESTHFPESTLTDRYSHTNGHDARQYSQSTPLYTTDQHFSPLQDSTTVMLKESEARMQTLSDLEISMTLVDQVTATFLQNSTILSSHLLIQNTTHSTEENTSISDSMEYLVTTELNQSSETHILPSFHKISSTPEAASTSHIYDVSQSLEPLVNTTTHVLYTVSHRNVTPTYLEESSSVTQESTEVLLDGTTKRVTLSEVMPLLNESIIFHQNKSAVSALQGSADITESTTHTVSKDTVQTHISHSATDLLVSSSGVTGLAISTEMSSLEPKSTQVSTTEYATCKYAEEFLTTQSEVVIIKQDYENLAADQVNNTITVVFRITQGGEQIDMYTKRFTMWMVQVLMEGMKEHKTESSSSNVPSSHGEVSNSSRVKLIYILPTPNIVSEDLIFTFIALATPNNDTVPLSEVIDAVLSDAEGVQNCMNLNLSYFIRGQYPSTLNVSQSLNQVWQKYGILLVTISVLTLLIVVILITAVAYLRCKSRRLVAYISDKDRLHCDLHASAEIGDLNRGSVILEDEVFEKDTSLVNGNHILTIGDEEGWLVPINDVPVEDHDAPDVQDTKL